MGQTQGPGMVLMAMLAGVIRNTTVGTALAGAREDTRRRNGAGLRLEAEPLEGKGGVGGIWGTGVGPGERGKDSRMARDLGQN